MSLLRYELRKLFMLPMLWVFLALCLALNGLMIFGNASGRGFFNETSGAARVLGQRVDARFLDGLAALPRTENTDALWETANGMKDVFQSYDVSELSAYYEYQVRHSPRMVRWIHGKYEKIALRVHTLAESGAGMDLYAGPMTHDRHQFLFGTLLRAVTTESALLGALASLYLLGCEDITRTACLLCASRAGRRQWRCKAAAGILASLVLWMALAGLSLELYFIVWDYGGIWDANVSGSFNYIDELVLVKPFLTWTDLTVAGYLAASLGMSASLALVCCLMACVAGLLIRSAYLAALAPVVLGGAGLLAAVRLGEHGPLPAFAAACFQPVVLWLDEAEWFTDSGIKTVVPWQEPITAALWLLLAGAALLAAYKRFCGKDI